MPEITIAIDNTLHHKCLTALDVASIQLLDSKNDSVIKEVTRNQTRLAIAYQYSTSICRRQFSDDGVRFKHPLFIDCSGAFALTLNRLVWKDVYRVVERLPDLSVFNTEHKATHDEWIDLVNRIRSGLETELRTEKMQSYLDYISSPENDAATFVIKDIHQMGLWLQDKLKVEQVIHSDVEKAVADILMMCGDWFLDGNK